MKNIQRLILTCLLTSSTAFAAPLYWDAGATGGSSLGGSGNWDTNTALWFNNVLDVVWTNGSDAYFEGTAGTVTLVDNVTAADLYFTNATGNYFITNATGAEVLTMGNTIDTGGGEHTIAAPIANSSTLNKNGAGRLHLPVDNSLTFTGNLNVNQGEVSIETNTAAGITTSITVANGAALEFNSINTNDYYNLNNITVSGSGVTNNGALVGVSGYTILDGTLALDGPTTINVPSGELIYDANGTEAQGAPITSTGSYNVIAEGAGIFYNGSTGFEIGTGSLTIVGPLTFYQYVLGSESANMIFQNVVVQSNATYEVEGDDDFGTVPSALMTTNMVLNGGTLASFGSYTMNTNRGITVTTNGGSILNASGTYISGNIYSSNTWVSIGGAGSQRPGGAAGTTYGIVNLGTGGINKVGTGDLNNTYAGTFIFSNLVISGGSFSEQYDSGVGPDAGLGAVPSTFTPTNIVFNGGSLHADHSYYMSPTRGITITTNNGSMEEVTGSGHLYVMPVITGPGTLTIISGGSGAQVVLCATNTYTGGTIINSSANCAIGTNTTSGTLPGNVTDNGSLTFNLAGSSVYPGQISGSGTLVNTGSGVVTLTGSNTYTGITTVSGGTLLLDGTNASSAISVSSGATLGGTGALGGTVTVNAGGTLALGSGTLSVSNNVSIVGNVSVSVNSSASPSSGTAIVTGTLANSGSGTVSVSNAGPALAPGNTFQLFSQPVSGGNTLTVSGGGVVWANNLAASGSISVVSLESKPVINSVSLSGKSFVFSGTNGATGGGYYVLATTNLTLPLSSWTPVQTNTFGANGVFSFTNTIVPGVPIEFYLLKLQ
jgi:fibronectin-binding autotransporter adhesin